MKTTTTQLATTLGVEYARASIILNLAVLTGQAKVVDVIKPEAGKRGKGTNVYEVSDTLTIDLTKPFPVKETAPEAEAVAG